MKTQLQVRLPLPKEPTEIESDNSWREIPNCQFSERCQCNLIATDCPEKLYAVKVIRYIYSIQLL